jgi:hypothetical protein
MRNTIAAHALKVAMARGRKMSKARYYRKQAEICSRLATAAGSSERATRLKVLALEMLLRAENASAVAEVAAAPTCGDLAAACGNHDQ